MLSSTAKPTVTLLGAVLLAATPTVLGVDQTLDPDAVQSLKMSPTELDKFAVLGGDPDGWTFDFWAHPYHTDQPGGVVNANAATFPATVGHGLTMAWITLGPCAMLQPHYHPRGSNFVLSIDGEVEALMTQENGAPTVKALLTPGKMMVLPAGSAHTMRNTGCETINMVSALNSEDTGTHNLANALASFGPEIEKAAYGNSADFNPNLSQSIPAVGTGASMGPESCLAACGITQQVQGQEGTNGNGMGDGQEPADTTSTPAKKSRAFRA